MLRAHARTDSRLSTPDYAEALPSRRSLAADDAHAHAHAPRIPLPLQKRTARRRALFFSQSRPARRAGAARPPAAGVFMPDSRQCKDVLTVARR
jgi:hypothetical protein